MTIQELQQLIEESKKAIPNNPVLSSRQPALPPDRSTISARHPYEVTLPYNQIGPFPSNMSAGAPRGEVAYDPRSYAKEAVINLPAMGLYGGKQALGYANVPRKFSSLADKMERFEISDAAAKLKLGGFETEGIRSTTPMGTKLGDVLTHHELIKQYPWLKDLPVDIRISRTGVKNKEWASAGEYRDGKLFVTAPDEASALDTLTHEIQHAIQEYEGFAKGGNVHTFEKKIAGDEAYFADILTRYPALIKIKDEVGTMEMPSSQRLREVMQKYRLDRKSAIDVVVAKKEELLDDLQKANSYFDQKINSRVNAYGMYKNLAGEIEARDAAFRRLYTDYERMTTQPGASQNIPLSDYIVNKGNR